MPAYAAAAAQIREKKGREGRRGKNQQESILIEQVREDRGDGIGCSRIVISKFPSRKQNQNLNVKL